MERGYASRREECFVRRDERIKGRVERIERRVERREERNCQSPQRRRSYEWSLGKLVRGFINTICGGFTRGGMI